MKKETQKKEPYIPHAEGWRNSDNTKCLLAYSGEELIICIRAIDLKTTLDRHGTNLGTKVLGEIGVTYVPPSPSKRGEEENEESDILV
jgi:hypothetical protein